MLAVAGLIQRRLCARYLGAQIACTDVGFWAPSAHPLAG